jgi:TonB family protein
LRGSNPTSRYVAALLLILAGCASTHPSSKKSAPPPPAPASISAPLDREGAPSDYVFVDELPEAIHKVMPQPVTTGATGTVTVVAHVGQDGRVQDVKVVKSIAQLDSLAMDAVRQWTFKPGKFKGKPVATWVTVPVTFKPR